MIRVILTILAICSSLAAYTQALSIDSIWSQASAYEKLRQANTNVSLANLNIKAEQLGRLPLIYGEANLQRNLITPSTPVPAIAFNPNAAPGEILPLKFATDWSAKAGVQFSMDIFNPQQKLALKTAELERKSAMLDYDQTLQDWKKQVTSAYAKVVISSKQYLESVADSARYAEIVNITQVRQNAGRTTLIELNKAKQELINRQTQLHEAFRVLEVANIELSKFADTKGFTQLSSSIPDIITKLKADARNIQLENIQIEQQKIGVQLQSLKKEGLPTLSLNAFYGSQFYNNSFSLWNNNNWFGNSYVNVGVRLPISETIDRALKKKQLGLQNQLLSSQYREEAAMEAANQQQQMLNIIHAEKALEHAVAIERLSTENIRLAQEQYKAGKILLSELNQELSTHFKNMQNVWQAEYDHLLAVLERYAAGN
jgi:outer membrane protein